MPLFVPSRVLGKAGVPGANDRIHVGIIGTGIRGKYLIGDMPGDGRLVAICDCYLPRVHEALKPSSSSAYATVLETFVERDAARCASYTDYRNWKGKGIVAKPHLQNWLDCIKTRSDPAAPVEVGHRTISICHLAGIARELRRKLRWDPVKETFPDDQEACTLLDRPRRPGWELPDAT